MYNNSKTVSFYFVPMETFDQNYNILINSAKLAETHFPCFVRGPLLQKNIALAGSRTWIPYERPKPLDYQGLNNILRNNRCRKRLLSDIIYQY